MTDCEIKKAAYERGFQEGFQEGYKIGYFETSKDDSKYKMTNGEAIIDIEENIMPIVGGKSLEKAIEALEKQIPQKPDEKKCPFCFHTAVYRFRKFKYCPECGQRILWE